MGEFDDILGEDDPEKEHKKWIEENKTEEPSNKSFKTLNDVYQKSQKRWKGEADVKEEITKRFEEAQKKLLREKMEFEQEYPPQYEIDDGCKKQRVIDPETFEAIEVPDLGVI